MKATSKLQLAAALLAAVLLAACSSTGDILGTGNGTAAAQDIRGTVDSVDLNSRSLVLSNATASNLGGNSTVRLYWDDQSYVEYNGNRYSPADLDRGDQVSARVDNSSGRAYIQSMSVLYNSRTGSSTTYPGGSTNPGGTYVSSIRGTVSYVDTAKRSIQIDQGSYAANRYATILYDANTVVQYTGRQYRPEDLERGDQIDVAVRDYGGGNLLAQTITVVQDVNSGTGGTTAATTLRGTVRNVDTSRRTIQLDQTSWGTGFTTGGSSVVLQYDSNTTVEYQGQVYGPTNLEQGDVVDVQVRDLGNGAYYAQRVVVVRNVRS